MLHLIFSIYFNTKFNKLLSNQTIMAKLIIFIFSKFNIKLQGCIHPCGTRSVHECEDVQNLTFAHCPPPTTIAPIRSTDLTPMSTEIPTVCIN